MGSRQKNNQNIQVYVRSRPLNAVERATSLSVVDVFSECKEVRIKEKYGGRECTKVFKFDKVFSPTCTQFEVYNIVMTPVIEEVLMGYNCTVFVYGQTGSGKTYTMEGEHSAALSWEKNPKTGIIPRALSQLFDDLQKQEIEYTLHISFLELYNEELFDLLSPENSTSKLRIFEDITRKGSVVIQGLEEIAVHSKEEVYSILEKGAMKRKTAATLLNATSSRSHTVFSITMHMKETTSNGDELLKTGKLNLVDLAGSENIGRSGAIEGRAREAGNINQSLLTLGRVITSLVEKAPHIPYRESKLTRLLQDSLGGKTKTTIIATISPAMCNLEETLSTLEYAHRAKKITNCPEVNQKTTKQALLKEYTQEIERLRRDLAAAREKNGIFVDADNYQNMQQELLCRSETIKDLNSTIEALKVEMEKVNNLFAKAEEQLVVKSVELEICSKELEVKTEKLEEKAKDLKQTKEILSKTEIERAEQAYLAEERAKTEKKLVSQTKKLIEVVGDSTSDVYALHAKLDRKSVVEVANEQHNSEFKQIFEQSMSKLKNHVSEMCQKSAENTEKLQNSISKTMNIYEENSNVLSTLMSEFICKHSSTIEHATTQWSEQVDVEEKWRLNLIDSVLKQKEAAMNGCNIYITEKLSPIADEIANIHRIMDNQISEMREVIHFQHKQQEENIRLFVEQFSEDIDEFKKNFSSFNSNIETQLKECADYANYIADMQTVIVKQYEDKKTEMENLTSALNEMIETFKTEMNNNIPKLLQCHSQLVTDSDNHRSTIEGYLEQMSRENQTFKAAVLEETNSNFVSTEDNMKKIRDRNAEILDKNTTLKTNIMAFGDCTEQVWQEYIDGLENNLDKHAEAERQNLKKNLGLIEEMDSLAKNTLSHHEEVLNNQRQDFELQLSSQKNENSMLEEIMKLQLASLLENAEECDEAFNSYITDWKTDTPTGETPQRKDYNYPKTVPESSPAERILQRFRAAIPDQTTSRKSTPLRIRNENDDQEILIKEACSKKTYARDSNSVQVQKIPKRILQVDKAEDKENASNCATAFH